MAILVLFVLSKTMVAQQSDANIGSVTEFKGTGRIVRDKPYDAVLDFDLNLYDNVRTAKGRIAITFLDDSIVRLTEHSKLIIDEYIFDPNPSNSKMALQFASGTIRFVSSALNKIDKKNISLKTPTADIAIRGTDFTVTVDELGRSLIILLPGEDGISSGEILVSTATGSVVLDKPYQATTTSLYESNPSAPLTLDITLDMIDNMMIVSPPKEEAIVQEEEADNQIDYLEFTDLDIDYLAEDLLEEDPNFEFTELDIDYLNVNFLEDLLDVIDDLGVEEEEDELEQFIGGIPVSGTKIGQDFETQITTILQGDQINIIRNVNQYVNLILSADQAYSVIIVQDGVSKSITINNGSSSTITITQG